MSKYFILSDIIQMFHIHQAYCINNCDTKDNVYGFLGHSIFNLLLVATPTNFPPFQISTGILATLLTH